MEGARLIPLARPDAADRGMRWDMAESLGRVAWSKALGWHVEFRTVKFGPDKRRVRILSIPGLGRIDTRANAQRVLYRILGEVANGVQLSDVLAWYVRKKLPTNLFIRRWEQFCDHKLLDVRGGHLARDRERELRACIKRGYFEGFANTSVHEIGKPELSALIRFLRGLGLGEKTIENVLGDVAHFLRWLADERVLHAVPAIPYSELRLEVDRARKEPRPLRWTTERPTVPGYWWAETVTGWVVMQISGIEIESDISWAALNVRRWAGPIPVPEEPI